MGTQFGGFVPDSHLPQTDCESGPSCSGVCAPVSGLGFTFVTGALQPCVLVARCVSAHEVMPWCFHLDVFVIGRSILQLIFAAQSCNKQSSSLK